MKPVLADAPVAPGSPRKKTIAAGPKKSAAPVAKARPTKAKTEPSRLDAMQKLIVTSLEDDKAENVVTLDLTGKAMFWRPDGDRLWPRGPADHRRWRSICGEKLHTAGQKRVQIEGLGGSDWVLIDAGDIVVHLFKPDARTMYGLEKMWGEDLDEAVAG